MVKMSLKILNINPTINHEMIYRNIVINKIKKNLRNLNQNQSGQGAAEYILLFGGVIVIAIAAILIYSSYFGNKTSDLNASQDINTIRENLTNV